MAETRNTPEQDYIIDYTGALDWQNVVETFQGKTLALIAWTLDRMFPGDDNEKLAKMIYKEVN